MEHFPDLYEEIIFQSSKKKKNIWKLHDATLSVMEMSWLAWKQSSCIILLYTGKLQ